MKALGLLVLFCLPAQAAELHVLHTFPCDGKTDGATPRGRLLTLGDTMLGATSGGGAGGFGTIFRIAADGRETVLTSFAGGKSGQSPYAGPIEQHGTLYGTTSEGGDADLGTVYALDAAGGPVRVLHSFTGGNDGQHPQTGLLAARGTLYGITLEGGAAGCPGFGCGTLYAIDPATGAERVLHRFHGETDGFNPEAAPILFRDALYGTAAFGGAHGNGLVWRIDPATGAETVLYSFAGLDAADGAYPRASLLAIGDRLYGTTDAGGARGCGNDGCGTVFALDAGGGETVLHRFRAEEGGNPLAELTEAAGALFGTTSDGAGQGSAFRLDPEGGGFAVLHDFTGSADGSSPDGPVLPLSGRLIGSAPAGGGSDGGGCGTVLSLDPR